MPCIEPYTSSRVKSERIPHAKKRVFIIKTVHKSTNAGTNARVDSTTPPFFSFFLQCRGPVLGFFFFGGGGIFWSVLESGPWLFFFVPWRAKFCTSEGERCRTARHNTETGSLSCHILQVSTRASVQRRLSHYQKVVTFVYWSFCEAKCGEVSIDALLQKRGACWAVNHGARWWRANAGAGERLTIYRDPGETMRWKG